MRKERNVKKAVIDIGSNTINLLIGDVSKGGTLRVYHDEKNHAKLARGGINKRTITPEAFSRGINAIEHYTRLCDLHRVELSNIKTYATATIRSTDNGKDFTEKLYKDFGIVTQIIDGKTEASLIFNGVKHGIPALDGNYLVLDIGGGSTEFIIANAHGILWKHSFELGVSKLLDLFIPSNPISGDDIVIILQHMRDKLKEFDLALSKYPVQTLVGSSGSFDTLRSIIAARGAENNSQESYFEIDADMLHALFVEFIDKSTEDRLKINGMDQMRAEYMPIAAILIQEVLEKTGIKKILQCSYALKEGAIFQK